MCMEPLLSKDEMSAHKCFCWHMMSANNEVNTLQSIDLVSDMVLGLLRANRTSATCAALR